MGILSAAMTGNMRRMSEEEAHRAYDPWLMPGEWITDAYQLVRDGFCITNLRIIMLDRQGLTGAKARVVSIQLDSIVNVTAETAGAGVDDSELAIQYISSAHQSGFAITYDVCRWEFNKNFDIAELYRRMSVLAFENRKRINGLVG